MLNRMILFACLIFLAVSSLSFQWPVEDGKITSTFGESRWDHFHDGVDLITSKPAVRPISDGKLLFFWDKSIFPLENYPGAGNYRVVSHEPKLTAIYMHLLDGSPVKHVYKADDVVGYVGDTGHSFGKHLHVGLYNPVDNSSLNPMQVLPKVDDIKKPVLYEFAIRVGDRYFPVKKGSKLKLTQHYPFLIMIQDSISGRERLGVYRLAVEFNQKKVFDVEFSKIDIVKNTLMIQNRDFDHIYDEKGYYKITGINYLDGENHVKLVARDLSGNETVEEVDFTINLNIK